MWRVTGREKGAHPKSIYCPEVISKWQHQSRQQPQCNMFYGSYNNEQSFGPINKINIFIQACCSIYCYICGIVALSTERNHFPLCIFFHIIQANRRLPNTCEHSWIKCYHTSLPFRPAKYIKLTYSYSYCILLRCSGGISFLLRNRWNGYLTEFVWRRKLDKTVRSKQSI